jgi:hypothetical protein
MARSEVVPVGMTEVVTGYSDPVCPRSEFPGVVSQGLPNVEHHALDHDFLAPGAGTVQTRPTVPLSVASRELGLPWHADTPVVCIPDLDTAAGEYVNGEALA